ncbi:unnamed protein product [Caenorhabditis sp. 36 PRJEB53466]|nr:unnamed protein product [Caenorhabditis sp. 36 PRJEB53466]
MASSSATKTEIEDQILQKISVLFEETFSKPPPSNIVELWKEHVAIRRTLNEVSSLQVQISETDKQLNSQVRDAETIKAFLTWSDSIGIARNNVTIGETEFAGLSLQATGPIPNGHVVARVPRHAMITLDMARKSPMLRKVFEWDPLVSGMDNVGLALFVAGQWLNKPNTKWNSYLSILPNSFPTPLFYTEEQLLQLKPSPIFEEAIHFFRTITRQFAYFLLAISKNRLYDQAQKKDQRNTEVPLYYNSSFTVANFTPTLYFWAVGVVTTRVNMVPSETATGEDGKPAIIPALIPVLDMANHESSDNPIDDLVCYAPDEECAVITSHCDMEAGRQVTIFYGARSKGEHLLHNGFVPVHHGKFDVLKLKFGIPKTDKALATKQELIRKLVASVEASANIYHVDLIEVVEHPFPEDLIIFGAIFVTPEPTEELVSTTEARKKGLEFLKTRFTLLRRSYDTAFDASNLDKMSIEGDTARLKSAELQILQLALNHCDVLEKTMQ